MATAKERMGAALKTARDISEKADAEGRDLTVRENEQATAALLAYKSAKKEFDTAPRFKHSISEDELNLIMSGKAVDSERGSGPGFRAKAGASWARKTAEIFQKVMASPDGAKALVSGAIDVPSVIQEPVEILGRPTSILDLVPKPSNTDKGNGNAFSYLRQTTRTNNAGPVADNATKPTSVYTFGDVEDTFRVYAHLSEVFPRRFLDDYNGLIGILQDQMGAGLMEALEEDILGGAVQPQDGFGVCQGE